MEPYKDILRPLLCIRSWRERRPSGREPGSSWSTAGPSWASSTWWPTSSSAPSSDQLFFFLLNEKLFSFESETKFVRKAAAKQNLSTSHLLCLRFRFRRKIHLREKNRYRDFVVNELTKDTKTRSEKFRFERREKRFRCRRCDFVSNFSSSSC